MSDKKEGARVRAAVRAHRRSEQRWVDTMNALVPHAPEIMEGPRACSPEVRKMFNEAISLSMEPSLLSRILEAKKKPRRKK